MVSKVGSQPTRWHCCSFFVWLPPNEVGYQRGTMIVSWPFFVTPFPNLAGYFRITRLSGPFSPKRRSGCSRMDCFMTIAAHHKPAFLDDTQDCYGVLHLRIPPFTEHLGPCAPLPCAPLSGAPWWGVAPTTHMSTLFP